MGAREYAGAWVSMWVRDKLVHYNCSPGCSLVTA